MRKAIFARMKSAFKIHCGVNMIRIVKQGCIATITTALIPTFSVSRVKIATAFSSARTTNVYLSAIQIQIARMA